MVHTVLFLFFTCLFSVSFLFFFNDTATTEIYTLSLHDALPISYYASPRLKELILLDEVAPPPFLTMATFLKGWRSEEHTSELQSHSDLVCRLLLEKKKKHKVMLKKHEQL